MTVRVLPADDASFFLTILRSMKLFALILVSSLFYSASAQVPDEVIAQYKTISRLVKAGDAKKMAKLIDYPLIRTNPLPNITTEQKFISYFNVLFDSKFKSMLSQLQDTDIFMHRGDYGIFSGDIWINDAGKIIAINYSSAAEQKLQQGLIAKIKSTMHPSVRDWINNILVYKCNDYTVRIDETPKGTRFASWKKNKHYSDPPDLILYNGDQKFYGDGAGVGYIFKSGDWSYLVEDVQVCADEKDCGAHLKIFHGDKLIRNFECIETK
jgi:hypothetical protein